MSVTGALRLCAMHTSVVCIQAALVYRFGDSVAALQMALSMDDICAALVSTCIYWLKILLLQITAFVARSHCKIAHALATLVSVL